MAKKEFKLFEDLNQNCFSNLSDMNSIWEYDQLQSSVKIFPQSLKPNETYQFMVQMNHHENTLLQSIGYLFVHVETIDSPIITIK